jgi:hypothetical protein
MKGENMAKKISRQVRSLPNPVNTLDLSSISEERLEEGIFNGQLTELIAAAVRQGLRVLMPDTVEAFFPLLDSWIELSLSLGRAFAEETRAFSEINPESRETPDELVEVTTPRGTDGVNIDAAAYQRPHPAGEPRLEPRVAYGSEYSNWALHQLIQFPNPARQDDNTSAFFDMMAEIGVTLKRTLGQFPKGLTWILGGTVPAVAPRVPGAQKRRRNKRNRRRGSATMKQP